MVANLPMRPSWLRALGRGLAAILLVWAGGAPARAEPAAAPGARAPTAAPSLSFERFRLDNGLEVIVHTDPTLPLVAVNVWSHVGPACEPAGRSGFAHLFEHLMFAGSRHVGDQFDELLEAAGATNVNGTTSWDRTAYFATVPREHLPRLLWIESDRMGYLLDGLDASRLAVQQGVVANERRETYEDAPYGPSTLALFDALFPPGHPYHGAIIGSIRDVAAATLADVERFYERYYAPSNATLVLAGDVAVADARRLVSRYFGTLPRRPPPPRTATATPPLRSPVRVEVPENVELVRVALGWIAPPAFGPTAAPLEVAATVLAGGRATRLYRALVTDESVATDVSAYVDANELASMVIVMATGKRGVSGAELERRLDAVIADLGRSGPTAEELARAKRRILVDLYTDLQLLDGSDGESGRAGLLQRYHHYLGDPGYLPRHVAQIEAVTADDVARVVTEQMDRNHRATVITRPAGASAEAKP